MSPAFGEDPLRVLRVARFAAKLFHLKFKIADETLELMQKIARTDELMHLSRERVWQETQRALVTDHPEIYILALQNVDALKVVFPHLSMKLDNRKKQNQLNRLHKSEGLESRYVALILTRQSTTIRFFY